MELKTNMLKNCIANWIKSNTQIIQISQDTYEIATTQIDSYGGTVYCFVQENNNFYKISDDSYLLFKLDPGKTDKNLYYTAEQIAIGSGFEFNKETCELSIKVSEKNIAQAIIKLAQLQVAISYLD